MTLRWDVTSQQETLGSVEAWHVPVIFRQTAEAVGATHVMQGTGQPMTNWAAPSPHVVQVLQSVSIPVTVSSNMRDVPDCCTAGEPFLLGSQRRQRWLSKGWQA